MNRIKVRTATGEIVFVKFTTRKIATLRDVNAKTLKVVKAFAEYRETQRTVNLALSKLVADKNIAKMLKSLSSPTQRGEKMKYVFDIDVSTITHTIKVSSTDAYGYFENNHSGSGGGLWFDRVDGNLILNDYDGVTALPMSVILALRSHTSIFVDKEFE